MVKFFKLAIQKHIKIKKKKVTQTTQYLLRRHGTWELRTKSVLPASSPVRVTNEIQCCDLEVLL